MPKYDSEEFNDPFGKKGIKKKLKKILGELWDRLTENEQENLIKLSRKAYKAGQEDCSRIRGD